MTRFFLLFLLPFIVVFSAEENFILINGMTNERVLELGPHTEERNTPCSTFKIPLSLMGFDAEILQDEANPVWLFQEGYDDFLESWKSPQTPLSWMKNSCVWYSRIIAAQLGWEKFQGYLVAFDYGNCDASGGLTTSWINSSLKISPKEQVHFLQKMLQRNFPLTNYAFQMTKNILFIEELPDGWKLFGKTGWTGSKPEGENELSWFVGWIEKEGAFFPFAYNIRMDKINLAKRIPRVKQLIAVPVYN